MKDLLLQARVVVRTSNMKISRCRLADYVQTLHQKACCTCSTIIFYHSTNQIIDLWRCRRGCHRQILNSLFKLLQSGRVLSFPTEHRIQNVNETTQARDKRAYNLPRKLCYTDATDPASYIFDRLKYL